MKATTKSDLIAAANENFAKLWAMIDKMTAEEQAADFSYDAAALTAKDGAAHWHRDKNLRDVLTHLYEWHQFLLDFEKANAAGEGKTFLPPPYTWSNYAAMNQKLWEKHAAANTDLTTAKEMLLASHAACIKMLSRYTDEQLFTKKYFPWTGSTSLGQYFNGPAVAHYDWAMKKLKAQLRQPRANTDFIFST